MREKKGKEKEERKWVEEGGITRKGGGGGAEIETKAIERGKSRERRTGYEDIENTLSLKEGIVYLSLPPRSLLF